MFIAVNSAYLLVSPRAFETPLLAQRLDTMTMPPEWANSEEKPNTAHLLSFPFLFSQTTLITYFRAINYAAMYKAFHKSAMAERLARDMTFTKNQTGPGCLRAHDSLRISQTSFLVLNIRRDNALTDAMNQLWRRQHRELMRPLKVQMGAEEGEEGTDLGGVQQEFFRLIIDEAMNPDFGMLAVYKRLKSNAEILGIFTTDPLSGISWFKPGSFEPEYKYELLGIFASLAIYNGVTIPFNLPKVFYRKLLGLSSRLVDLADGWPQLAKGLEDLRDYDGDVEGDIMREYAFSMDVFGTTINIDISRKSDKGFRTRGLSPRSSTSVPSDLGKHESTLEKRQDIPTMHTKELNPGIGADAIGDNSDTSTSSEPPMVTNVNRHQYISDYINHLTNLSVATQYHHFTLGFFRCITRKSLKLFNPTQLKNLVEGTPFIDVARLRQFTSYDDGYHASHPTIDIFWGIVQNWDQDKVGRLLEFVTASDRLPIGGEERVNFEIQRNGDDDERLPTSMTCFGKLLLPDYASVERMEKALDFVVEHAKGFGAP